MSQFEVDIDIKHAMLKCFWCCVLTCGKTARHVETILLSLLRFMLPIFLEASFGITWFHPTSAISLIFLSSVRRTTAEANGLWDILIWSVMSGSQHEVGYVRLGLSVKSWKKIVYRNMSLSLKIHSMSF